MRVLKQKSSGSELSRGRPRGVLSGKMLCIGGTMALLLAFHERISQLATIGDAPNTATLSSIRPRAQEPLYSKPTEPMYIPEPLRSSNINATATNFSLMSLPEIYSVVQKYVAEMSNNFRDISRLIYESALEKNRILLTLQIGGMDGISNDPMYEIFVKDEQLSLHNWFPIVVEPVTTNFGQLKLNYANFQEGRGLPGAAVRQYAITSERDHGTCEFCHWHDTSMEQKCVEAPDWIRLQLGTLDCAHLEGLMGEETSKLCIVHDQFPCGTVSELLFSLGFGKEGSSSGTSDATVTAPIGILQIDVEGFEVFILQSLMDEISDEDNLPLVIHFERKVMWDQDTNNRAGRKVNGTKIETTFQLMHQKGYVMYNLGEDVMALRVNPAL